MPREKIGGFHFGACNSALGPIPALTTTTNDYNFALINFDDASIVPYPGKPTGFN